MHEHSGVRRQWKFADLALQSQEERQIKTPAKKNKYAEIQKIPFDIPEFTTYPSVTMHQFGFVKRPKPSRNSSKRTNTSGKVSAASTISCVIPVSFVQKGLMRALVGRQ